MQIAERLNFNTRLMDFCLRAIDWKENGPQETYLGTFAACLERTIIAEQLFRAELTRPRPGIYVRTAEDDE